MDGPSVLMVARTLPWHIRGGMEEHTWSLARALRDAGGQVEIYTTAFDGVRTSEKREGIHIEYLPHLPRRRDRIPMWRWWGRFPKACQRVFERSGRTYGLIISEAMFARRLFASARARPAAKCFVWHGTGHQAYHRFARADLLQRVPRFHPRAIAQFLWVHQRMFWDLLHMRRADWVVAVSPSVADSLRTAYRVPAGRLRVIGNGVDLPGNPPSRDAARAKLGLSAGPWILFLGRLEPNKDPTRLLDVLARRPEWRLLIAGTGSLEAKIRGRLEADPSLRARVRFLGFVDDETKWRCFAACDVFALPSRDEGEPISILEALGSGRPVATTEAWVAGDLRGAVAVSSDIEQAIVAALDLGVPAQSAARLVREHHTWPEVARRFLELAGAR